MDIQGGLAVASSKGVPQFVEPDCSGSAACRERGHRRLAVDSVGSSLSNQQGQFTGIVSWSYLIALHQTNMESKASVKCKIFAWLVIHRTLLDSRQIAAQGARQPAQCVHKIRKQRITC